MAQKILIKYGGNAMTDPLLQRGFANDIVALQQEGYSPIVVHGGGPQISECLERLAIKNVFHNGLRYTDETTMQAVQWVLGGEVQPLLVRLINHAGAVAVGLNGNDAAMVTVVKQQMEDGFDIGQVGRAEAVNPQVLELLINAAIVPVISSFGADSKGVAYNVNADTMASAIAIALKVDKVILMSNIPGILDAENKMISSIKAAETKALIESGVISGGMIPKINAVLDVLATGVAAVQIIDGREQGILQRAITAQVGTTVYR